MNLSSTDQILQLIAWLLALLELILGLYIFVLNWRARPNRYVAFTLLLFSIVSFGMGLMMEAQNAEQARWPAILMTSVTPAIQPAILIITFLIVKSQWLFISKAEAQKAPFLQAGRILWVVVYGLVFLPAILTLIDVVFGTQLLFTGLPAGDAYKGGFVEMKVYANGLLGSGMRIIYYPIITTLSIVFLAYFAFLDRSLQKKNRGFARVLLAAQVIAWVIAFPLASRTVLFTRILTTSTIYAMIYMFTAFQQMIYERQYQRGSLQVRLTALVLVVTIPVLFTISIYLSNRAETALREETLRNLQTNNASLSANATVWSDLHVKILQELAERPEIASMSPVLQKSNLEGMVRAYPYMYLVSIVGPDGMNTARSDNQAPKDYSDRIWFKEAVRGQPYTYDVVAGRTSGQPALILAVPIRNKDRAVVGVAMFATDLDVVTSRVQVSHIGKTGAAFITDASNRVIAHPDPRYSMELVDLSEDPSVKLLRQGQPGLVDYVGQDGKRWYAYTNSLLNNWGVIIQIPEEEFLAPVYLFRTVARIILVLATGLLTIMALLTVYQTVRPIQTLTQAAKAVSAGDLSQVVSIESEDEIGTLANTFNQMTSQLQGLVGGLEERVAERTRDLERRAIQFQVTAEVAREATTIRDLEQLLEKVSSLISSRFSFYHTGIFLVDEAREYAVLRAASSEGGQRMLARGHRLKIGQVGIVGFVAARNEPRIALDVGEDAVFFNNPDLPHTRSEAGLPLTVREQVIGVLDVQSTEESAFNEEDIAIFQILADQIAVAIENARLLRQSQQSVQELQTLYGSFVRESWHRRLDAHPAAFTYDRLGVQPAQGISLPPDGEYEEPEGIYQMIVPIMLRGQRLGSMVLRRPVEIGPWKPHEEDLVREAISQVALALENARLIEEVQRRAGQEQMVSEIAARVQSSLDIESVMKIAVTEIGRALDIAKIQIRLNTDGEKETSWRLS